MLEEDLSARAFILRQRLDQTFARHRRHLGSGHLRRLAARQLEDGRGEVHHMAHIMADVALARHAVRPMDDHRRRDASFIHPDLETPKRTVARGRPASAQTEMRRPGTRIRVGIMAVAAHHHFRAGAVVGQEEDHRIVQHLHRPELIQNLPDLAIHAIDHGRMNRHFHRLVFFLIRGQILPSGRFLDLARPKGLEIALLVDQRGRRIFPGRQRA